MLQQFTWQHFLIAASVLTLLWYAAVILIFYRRELLQLFGNGSPEAVNRLKTGEPLPHRWESGVETLDNEDEPELMGKVKLPEGISMVETSGLRFATNSTKEEQIGLVPDVLQEIRQVFSALAAQDGNKKDFFRLMQQVSADYPKISSHPNIDSINEFIADHAPFHLSNEELENLWD